MPTEITGFTQTHALDNPQPRYNPQGQLFGFGTGTDGNFEISPPPSSKGYIAQYLKMSGGAFECHGGREIISYNREYTEYFESDETGQFSNEASNDFIGIVMPVDSWGEVRIFAEAKYFQGNIPPGTVIAPESHPAAGMPITENGSPPIPDEISFIHSRWVRIITIRWNYCYDRRNQTLNRDYYSRLDSFNPENLS